MATNFAKADYMEIVDLQTVADKVSIIGIHTPTGIKPRKMLAGFFMQFRKYKYTGCDVAMVPAARLPVDPLGLSLEAGQNNADMRDIVNPVLFHGAHGDNLNNALNIIYSDSSSMVSTSVNEYDISKSTVPYGESLNWEAQYYRSLSDPTFRKTNVQAPLRLKGLHPMVYNVVTNHQITNVQTGDNAVDENVGKLQQVPGRLWTSTIVDAVGNVGKESGSIVVTPQLSTNRLTPLGWLDTRNVLSYTDMVGNAPSTLQKLFMGIIILPPSYRTKLFFRLVITHHFCFKEFNTSLSNAGAVDYTNLLEGDATVSHAMASDCLECIDADTTITSAGVY